MASRRRKSTKSITDRPVARHPSPSASYRPNPARSDSSPPSRAFGQHLIIFARAPRIGRAKTRLAHTIGAIAAWRFHRLSLRSQLARLRRVPGCRRYLLLTPDPRRPRIVAGWRVLGQGAGDLGARLTQVLDRLPPGPAVILGTDSPDVDAGHVRAAFRALGNARLVVGPAVDGGYWLIGLRRLNRATPFKGVRWSTAHALADTLAAAGTHTVARLSILDDVDDGEDYARWQAREGARPVIDRLTRPRTARPSQM